MKPMNLLLALLFTSCSSTTKGKLELVSVRTTAYTHSERDHIKYGRSTAIGTTLKSGTIATDWSVFPVETVLLIDGKEYIVEDYGSALVGKDNPVVDIYTPSRKAMNSWGTQYFDDVEVLEWGDWEKSQNWLKDRLRFKHCRVMYEKITQKLKDERG